MKYIMKFIHQFIRKPIVTQKPMGRWNLDYCNTKLNNKIDLSNEDHCGPCGQYALSKNKDKDKDKDKDEDKDLKKN